MVVNDKVQTTVQGECVVEGGSLDCVLFCVHKMTEKLNVSHTMLETPKNVKSVMLR